MKDKRKALKWVICILLGVILIGINGRKVAEAANTYVVIFELNGGKCSVEYIPNVQHDATISLPTPTKDGYTFKGWYQDSSFTIPFTNSTKITNNITLYAKWEQKYVVSLTVTYKNQTAIVDSYIKKSDLVVVAKYWDNTSEVVTDYELADSLVKNKGANYFYITYRGTSAMFTVYGVPEPRYTVYFDSKGGNSIKPVTNIRPDGMIALPAEPTRDGYEFQGWYTSTAYVTEFTSLTKINSNMVVYAKWKKEEEEVTTVTYKLNAPVVNVKVNETNAVYIPSLDQYLEVSYRSSNTKIVSVSDKGIITGNKNGKAKIYVTAPDGTILTCKVGVGTKKYVTKITIPSSKKLTVGATYQIKPSISPSTLSKKLLSYSTSNSSIATVGRTGKVKAKGKGTCYITVRANDGSDTSKKMKVVVS